MRGPGEWMDSVCCSSSLVYVKDVPLDSKSPDQLMAQLPFNTKLPSLLLNAVNTQVTRYCVVDIDNIQTKYVLSLDSTHI